ncbi:hypothetical protein GN956_G25251 [Arapaima gigas]
MRETSDQTQKVEQKEPPGCSRPLGVCGQKDKHMMTPNCDGSSYTAGVKAAQGPWLLVMLTVLPNQFVKAPLDCRLRQDHFDTPLVPGSDTDRGHASPCNVAAFI